MSASTTDLVSWKEAEVALGQPVVCKVIQPAHPRAGAPALPYAVPTGASSSPGALLSKACFPSSTPMGRHRGFDRPSTSTSRRNLRRARPVLSTRPAGGRHSQGRNPAQVALAWLTHHPNVVAIAGAGSLAQLEENAAAADLALADDEVAHLTAAEAPFVNPPGPGRRCVESCRRWPEACGSWQRWSGGGIAADDGRPARRTT